MKQASVKFFHLNTTYAIGLIRKVKPGQLISSSLFEKTAKNTTRVRTNMEALLILIAMIVVPVVLIYVLINTYLSGKAYGEKLVQQADWKYNGKAYMDLANELGRTPTIDELEKVHKKHPII